ncbi:MAG: YdcF family protein [Verrucomicrobiota bacterium]|nr:YdcF family protein [Verrucomicrobiota bacterium]
MGPFEALVQPLGAAWAGALLVGVLAFRRKAWLAGFTSFGLAGALWLVGGTPMSALLLARLERPYDRMHPVNLPVAEAVVVLSGDIRFSGRELLWFSTGSSFERTLSGLEILRQGKARSLVVGGAPFQWQGGPRAEGELLASWIRAWRLPAGDLVRLPACRDTREEAVAIGELVRKRGWRRVILVSSASHLARGAAACRKEGVEVIPVGCDFAGLDALDRPQRWWVVPRSEGLLRFERWLHEELGEVWYWWRGWI